METACRWASAAAAATTACVCWNSKSSFSRCSASAATETAEAFFVNLDMKPPPEDKEEA
jgi:hypothetical protein